MPSRVGLAFLLAALVITACSSGSNSHVIVGSVYEEISQPHGFSEKTVSFLGHPCLVGANMQVVVENPTGHLLSTASLVPEGIFALSPATGVDSCRVDFTLRGVGAAHVYRFQVSGFRPVDYTSAQMAANHWTAAITLVP